MAIAYVEVNASNVGTWKQPIHDFASALDIGQRCNAAAVAKARWDRTYPSLVAIQEFVDKHALVVVAHDAGAVRGYLVCVDDDKWGGCQAKWIGAGGVPPAQLPGIFAAMGNIAVAQYGWLWGRVSNATVRNIMITAIEGCEISGSDPEIVTYWKP